jgi:hypothetical protein
VTGTDVQRSACWRTPATTNWEVRNSCEVN